MKRIIAATVLLALGGFVFGQQVPDSQGYNLRSLQMLGLSQEEIEQVTEIQEDSMADIRRLQADQEVRKAELARLLLDENPNMRAIERNLRASAAIEVDIRMVEIRRELAIREIIGTDRWARLVQAMRERRDAAGEVADQAAERFHELQEAIARGQRDLSELIQRGRSEFTEEELQERFRELQQQYQELGQLLRERLQ